MAVLVQETQEKLAGISAADGEFTETAVGLRETALEVAAAAELTPALGLSLPPGAE